MSADPSPVPPPPIRPGAPARKRGAPLGNTNALKHGFYARAFHEAELSEVADLDPSSLENEIQLMRVFIRRTALLADKVTDLDQSLALLSVMSRAAHSLASLMRTQQAAVSTKDHNEFKQLLADAKYAYASSGRLHVRLEKDLIDLAHAWDKASRPFPVPNASTDSGDGTDSEDEDEIEEEYGEDGFDENEEDDEKDNDEGIDDTDEHAEEGSAVTDPAKPAASTQPTPPAAQTGVGCLTPPPAPRLPRASSSCSADGARVAKNENHLIGAGFKPARRIQSKTLANEIGYPFAGLGGFQTRAYTAEKTIGASEKAIIVNVLSDQYNIGEIRGRFADFILRSKRKPLFRIVFPAELNRIVPLPRAAINQFSSHLFFHLIGEGNIKRSI
jgi:hypothetical protein